MKIEKLEDVLQVNIDKLKADESKKVIRRVQQLLKTEKEVLDKPQESTKEKDNILNLDNYQERGFAYINKSYVELGLNNELTDVVILSIEKDPHDRGFMMANKALTNLEKQIMKRRK